MNDSQRLYVLICVISISRPRKVLKVSYVAFLNNFIFIGMLLKLVHLNMCTMLYHLNYLKDVLTVTLYTSLDTLILKIDLKLRRSLSTMPYKLWPMDWNSSIGGGVG
jgi:hypothetical protein